MKFTNKNFNDKSDDDREDNDGEPEQLDEGWINLICLFLFSFHIKLNNYTLFCFVEGQAAEESGDDDEVIDVGDEAKDVAEESDGDEVDDDEDVLDDGKENIPKPKLQQRQSLGGDKKIVLKKPVSNNSNRPSAQVMVHEALKALNEKTGSSATAIKKSIMNKYPDLDERRLKLQIKRYLKHSLTHGKMIQIKRSFKLPNEVNKKQANKAKPKTKLEKDKDKDKEKEKQKEKKEKVRSERIS